jgi:hypothetical protein
VPKAVFAIVIATLSASGAFATRSWDFDDTSRVPANSPFERLFSALMAGRDVRVVTRFNQCTVAGAQTLGPAIVGGLRVQEFLIADYQHIAFSTVHETLTAHNEIVTEFIRYRVSSDGKVSVRTASVRRDNSAVGNAMEYACELGKGVSFSP